MLSRGAEKIEITVIFLELTDWTLEHQTAGKFGFVSFYVPTEMLAETFLDVPAKMFHILIISLITDFEEGILS